MAVIGTKWGDDDLTKRYWVFTYPSYYPGGGMCDLLGTYDTYEEAEKALTESGEEWGQIVDVQDRKVMKDL